MPEASEVHIDLYDVRGHLVRRLALGTVPAGYHVSRDKVAHWDGRNQVRELVSSGVYLIRLTAGTFSAIRRMVVMK